MKKTLFDATNMNGLMLKNRLIRSATWDGLVREDGSLPENLFKIYEAVAAGGVGAIVTALGDVKENDWCIAGNMRFCDDNLIPDYRRLVETVHNHDCIIIPQLNMHHYRSYNVFNRIDMESGINRLTLSNIEDIKRHFAEAAKRVQKCGFDAIQIHCGYGWLLSRSLDPACNHRNDNYGGTPQKRARLAAEVLQAIKSAVPGMHVMGKIGIGVPGLQPADLNKPGGAFPAGHTMTAQYLNDFVEVCKELEKNGMDSFEIAGIWHPIGVKSEAEFAPYAKAVQQAVSVPVISVGGHRNIDNMERLLNGAGIEYFSMCRSLIREPDLPNRWKSGDRSPAKCVSCDACFETYGKRCRFEDSEQFFR